MPLNPGDDDGESLEIYEYIDGYDDDDVGHFW